MSMVINNRGNGGGTFVPHPATIEPVRAVCVDVTDPTPTPTAFGVKDMFKLVFETETETEKGDGAKYCVWSRRFSCSLNEKSAFRAFLKTMFGEDVAITKADENGNLDVEKLCLGFPVKLMIVHEDGKDGEVYANISTIFPDRSSAPLKPTGKFTRKKDRPEREGQQGGYSTPSTRAAQGVDWKATVIHSGKHKGKRLSDLTAEELPGFLEAYLGWHAKQSTTSPADDALRMACREALNYLDKIEDGIDF